MGSMSGSANSIKWPVVGIRVLRLGSLMITMTMFLNSPKSQKVSMVYHALTAVRNLVSSAYILAQIFFPHPRGGVARF